MFKKIILVLGLLCASLSQPCLNFQGQPVSWWVQLLFPGSVAEGFAYLDSTFTNSQFEVHSEVPESPTAPLAQTLNQINQMNLQSIAWNDETPAGKTSSTKAHSKAVVAFDI